MFQWIKSLTGSRTSGESANTSGLDVAGSTIEHRDSEAARQEGNRHLAQQSPELAEQSFQQAIKLDPENAAAYLGLGFALLRLGRIGDAKKTLRRSLQLKPNDPDTHYLLGHIFMQEGDGEGARNHFLSTLALESQHDQARSGLCDLLSSRGDFYMAQGKPDLAIIDYRDALGFKPNLVEIRHKLGICLLETGQAEAACDELKPLVPAADNPASILSDLGLAYHAAGQVEKAEDALRDALDANPGLPAAHYRMAVIHLQQGRVKEALEHARQAVDLDQQDPQARSVLGQVLLDGKQYPAAIEAYTAVLAHSPNDPAAHGKLGYAYYCLAKSGQDQYLPLAESSLQKSVSLKATSWSCNHLGNVHYAQERLEDALACYRRAVELDDRHGDAKNNLMALLAEIGQLAEATDIARKRLESEPDSRTVHSCLLFLQSCTFGVSGEDYLLEAKRFGGMMRRNFPELSMPFDPAAGSRPLRVGLVSGDLNTHPVSFFLEGVLGAIDPANIQLHAYPTNPREDETTKRLQRFFTAWRPIDSLSDMEASNLIRSDRIDILIDLSGHTEHNRLDVFARRAAPVQVSWLGYWASTGLATMDYFLSDPVTVPSALANGFVERVWYLPDTRLCFTPPEPCSEIRPPPVLRNGFLTLASYQKLTKINDSVLRIWARIIAALPQARLRLQTAQLSCPSTRDMVSRRLDRFGIQSDQLDLVGGMSRSDYLDSHAEVDIILDTFPYPGGTTTCEALWMGVPTITLAGDTPLSRQGASILACAGLNDWITDDVDEYVRKVIVLAQDTSGLAELRTGLRGKVGRTPLFDGKAFAWNLEEALRGMWNQSASEAQPSPLKVSVQ